VLGAAGRNILCSIILSTLCISYIFSTNSLEIIQNTIHHFKYFEDKDEPVFCPKKGKGCDQGLEAEHV